MLDLVSVESKYLGVGGETSRWQSLSFEITLGDRNIVVSTFLAGDTWLVFMLCIYYVYDNDVIYV